MSNREIDSMTIVETCLDFNYVRPYIVLLQFNFNFMTNLDTCMLVLWL